VDQLQVLRDEFDIDHATGGILQIPDVALALFLSDGAAHFQNVVGNNAGLSLARQNIADNGLDLGLKSGRC